MLGVYVGAFLLELKFSALLPSDNKEMKVRSRLSFNPSILIS